MLVSYFVGRQHSARPAAASTSARHVLYWVDPMHPDYKSDHAGVAPDCGMQLEPVYAEPVSSAVHRLRLCRRDGGHRRGKTAAFRDPRCHRGKIIGTEKLRVLGRVVPEDTRVYKVDAGMEGFIRQTFNDSVGELVKKNQKLATYYGADSLAVLLGSWPLPQAYPAPPAKMARARCHFRAQ